ncbi:MAG: radical SAM protein [Candidatus Omnitrophica bacterium]|nr:radical SAM protein [Candidatus Omnitrophota bacterium]
MKEIQYKKFSWHTHKKNWRLKQPNVCQFELTFGCGLRCKHCYTDCYNKPSYLKKELNTEQVKFILDKVYNAGIIWVCFTGGDPLIRPDFLDIYSYAKDKGFIVTVFTSGYSIDKKVVKYFEKRPPFVIETTLNAATEQTYEKISQVKGSFKKVIEGIDLILKANISLKVKTQITRDNLEELSEIKKVVEGLGLKFRPSTDLHARLNGNLAPCNLRISPQRVLNLDGKVEGDCINESKGIKAIERHSSTTLRAGKEAKAQRHKGQREKKRTTNDNLFRCAIGGGDGINIDPYGNIFSCNLIREPKFNLLKVDIEYAQNKLLSLVRGKKFTTNSKCRVCDLKELCHTCPGRAYVETSDKEAPIPYYCELSEKITKLKNC